MHGNDWWARSSSGLWLSDDVLTFVLALKAERGADCGVTGEPATRAAAVLLWGVAARGNPAP